MPARHVRHIIRDQCALDVDPRLNTSSYVTVECEDEEKDIRLQGRRFGAKREITLIARGMKLTRLCSHASVAALLPAHVEQCRSI